MSSASVLPLLMLGACSFATVRGPNFDLRGQRIQQPDSCTDSYVAPIVDTLGASVLAGLGAAALAAKHTEGTFAPDLRGVVAGAFLVPAALYAAAAVYGYATVHACRSPDDDAIARGDPDPVTPEQLPTWLPLAASNPRARH